MYEEIQARCRTLARRAGLSGMPTVAVIAAVVLLGVVVLLALWRWWPRGESTLALAPPPGRSASGGGSAADAKRDAAGTPSDPTTAAAKGRQPAGVVCVHMVGAVIHPGVYELATGKRVSDAVDAAGGMSGNAAQQGLNLARALVDGEQIAVPTQDEYAKAGASGPRVAGGTASPGGIGSAAAQAGASGARPLSTMVNINTADVAMLDTLPGVGPSTAAKIVADREANGAYASVDDLGRVAGIGPKKLDQLKASICVR